MPELHIITGSNGAGKSTVGPDYLPPNIRNNCEIFNGDKVFQDKKRELWLQGIRAIKESRKIASDFVDSTFDSLRYNAISKLADFCYEGHFTNEATWNVPREFKKAGYSINLIFFGLSDPELSQLRVIDRTKEGGHYVTPFEVEANFYGNLEKLDKHFEMFDTVQIIDTSETEHLVITTLTNGIVYSSIQKEDIPEWFAQNLPNIINRIMAFKSN